MNKVTIAVVTIIILLFGGLVVSSLLKNSTDNIDYSKYDSSKIIEADDNNGNIADHVRGKADSEVVFVEYADLQCPGCAAAMPRISELTKAYGDRVAFVFRNFPISGHQNARAASAAVESAGKQGYFWEMLETLYVNRATWIESSGSARTDIFAKAFMEIAPEGDESEFRKMLLDSNIEKKINFDYSLGVKNDSVNGTPALYVNGEGIDVAAAKTQDELRDMAEAAINKALEEKGIETGAHYDFLKEESETEAEAEAE